MLLALLLLELADVAGGLIVLAVSIPVVVALLLLDLWEDAADKKAKSE
jgi:hypothetical protein